MVIVMIYDHGVGHNVGHGVGHNVGHGVGHNVGHGVGHSYGHSKLIPLSALSSVRGSAPSPRASASN